jgi:hypothetical protein
MNSNKKLLLIVTVMLLLLMTAIVVNVAINFRDYSYKSALDKASSTAKYVRDGLTAHMVNGIMDKREFFLNNIKNHKDIQDFWIIRGKKVIEQFGPGFKNEGARDSIDKEVIESGEMHYKIIETADKATLRVTIPYIASAYGSPNCLNCHNANEGDVLGAISMEFDIQETRYAGIRTVAKIIGINIIFLIIALIAINYFFKPIMTLFSELSKMIQYAHMGDYSKRIDLHLKSNEGREVVDQINNLFEKLQSTFKDLKNSLSTFVSSSQIVCQNPLEESKKIISELSNIYKFKKTIELDRTYEDIFERIVDILQNRFLINNYKIFIMHKESGERELIHSLGDITKCDCSDIDKNIELCRAHRTGVEVLSIDFNNICKYCKNEEGYEYICIPFSINNEIDIVISIFTPDRSEYDRVQGLIKHIENYLDAAKPVLESKLLMKKLKDSALKDTLTGLYNRRFLENFIEKFTKQASRVEANYVVMMIDIDYFKMVNDTYCHI